MRSLIFITVLFFQGVLYAQAQPPRVTRINVISSGAYEVISTDNRGQITAWKFISDRTAFPGEKGLRFGFQYEIIGKPQGATVHLKYVTLLQGKKLDVSEYDNVIGNDLLRGARWPEGYFGVYRLQIWYQNRKLAERRFTVTNPDHP